jgi:hypothetical protein
LAFAPGLAGLVHSLAGQNQGVAGLVGLAQWPGAIGMMGLAPGYAGLAAQHPGLASQTARVYVPSLAGPVAMDVVK